MSIPKITHQTAATSDLTEPCRNFRRRLQELHPHWQHRFYDDHACRDLIRQRMPHLLPLYDHYPSAVQRADLFRVVVVYLEGGFYLDLDMECHRPLDPLCDHHCVLAEEKTLTPEDAARLGHADTLRIANYMFGAEPAHPFWLAFLEAMLACAGGSIETEDDILDSTGPGLLTVHSHRWLRHPHSHQRQLPQGIELLPNGGQDCTFGCGPSCWFGAYAHHHHLGSWRWQHSGNPSAKPVAQVAHLDTHDRDQIGRWLALDRRLAAPKKHYVLNTYSGEQSDGLSAVFRKFQRIGEGVDDSRHLRGQNVLVPGIPFLYTERLSRANLNVAYTTFESSALPSHWVQALNSHYDHCIVPHASVAEIFRHSGVRIPLHIIHQGFSRWPRTGSPPADLFRVGFLGVPVQRKNLHKLWEACKHLAEDLDDLRLKVHVSHYYEWMGERPPDSIKKAPFVEWTEGVLDPNQMAQWYGDLSCYVFPSSGEGWSFTPRESLFLGIPTVLSDIPAHRELLASGFCTPIPGRGLEPANMEAGGDGAWTRVVREDIMEAIRTIYSNRSQAQKQANEGSRWIESRWLDVDAELQVLDLLDAL